MKKIILIVCLLFLVGCSQELKLKPKKCSYCGGKIFWHLTEKKAFQNEYKMNYEEENGKYYHKWCYKIMKERIK